MWLFKRGAKVSAALAIVSLVAFAVQSVRAQEFNEEESVKHKPVGMALQISGKSLVFLHEACLSSSNSCFAFQGKVTANGKAAGLSGEAELSNCEENTKKKMTCCSAAGGEEVAISAGRDTIEGEIFFAFSGTACQKTNSITEKMTTNLTVTAGTYKFKGATGRGRQTMTDNTTSGKGTITAQGMLK